MRKMKRHKFRVRSYLQKRKYRRIRITPHLRRYPRRRRGKL